MKKLLKKFREERGQAMVIVALSLVVLLGATALSVDVGMQFNTKAKLQAAADAAALAGAQDLPKPYDPQNFATAKSTALNYAGLNDVQVDNVQVVAPYAGDPKLIEVTCTGHFEYIFARVLGFDTKDIVVRAVATREATWAGDALPFMNLDDTYSTGSTIVLWEKTTAQGDYERLWDNNNPDYEYVISGTPGNYVCQLVDLADGHVAIKSGVSANNESLIIGLCQQYNNHYVYVLSLKNPNETSNYANKQQIPATDIVLLKCKLTVTNFTTAFGSAIDRGITLQYTGVSYPLDKVISGEVWVPSLNNNGEPVIKLVQ
jgi:Flp pilus assembly protein TadG